MKRKVVVFGGGTGLSFLLKGLKKFPVDISAIVSVCDDGKSTGQIREEFDMPAVGDLRRVIISLSESDEIFDKLFNHRFKTTGNFNGHVLGNLILAALTDINGNLSNAIESIKDILKLKGEVIPLTESNVTLMAKTTDGIVIEGEHNITQANKKIEKIYYKKNPIVNPKVLMAIKEADLIILSMGSIYTSVLPNLICKEVLKEINSSKAKIMYVCNMVTQPGETDGFKVSDHVNLYNKFLGKRKVDIVIANDTKIDKKILKIYETKEQKDQVKLDTENLKSIELIKENLFTIENNIIRHDSFKLGFLIYSHINETKNIDNFT